LSRGPLPTLHYFKSIVLFPDLEFILKGHSHANTLLR
jgi:hypothetical protein